MLGVGVGDRARLGVDGRVDLRELLQRLDGGLRDEREVRQGCALASLEVVLVLRAELRHGGEVDLDRGGELSGHVQRLHHAAGDGGAEARDLLRRAALARDRSRGGGRRRCLDRRGWRRHSNLGGLGSVDDVLLADPATDSGAGDDRKVDTVLGGELAYERRHVRVARIRVAGTPGGHRVRGLRSGRGSGRCGRGCHGLRCHHGRRCRHGLRCRRRFGCGCGGRHRCCESSGVADHGEYGSARDRLVDLDADLEDRAGNRRGDFGVDLVRRDLDESLVDVDVVTDLLQPARDGAFGHALAQRGQRDLDACYWT